MATDVTGGFTTTTIDQSFSAGQTARINGHWLASNDWGHAGDPNNNNFDSRDDVLLEELCGDEKTKVEHGTLPGTVV
jgi:hypothetical protein